jgi:hypothetical protein
MYEDVKIDSKEKSANDFKCGSLVQQIPPGLSQASYSLAMPPQHAFCALHSYPIILGRIETHSLSEV